MPNLTNVPGRTPQSAWAELPSRFARYTSALRVMAIVFYVVPLADGVAKESAGGAGATPSRVDAVSQANVPQPQFAPTISDLMTMWVQPRHIKLGLAGRAGNWTYAVYEADELRNAFRRVGLAVPVYNKSVDIPTLIAQMTATPLAAVQAAARQKDRTAFDAAYADLTAACNACHVSQRHAPIVIKVPIDNPYTDQEFQPPPAQRGGE